MNGNEEVGGFDWRRGRDGMGLYFRFFVNKWQAATLLSDMAVEVVVTSNIF